MLSVIVPAHLEEKRIGKPLGKLAAYLQLHKIRFEILVMTDPQDGTAKAAKKAFRKTRIGVAQNEGKGAAIQRGLSLAKGKILLVYDADGATPPDEIPKVLEALKTSEVAIGVRNRAENPWYRRVTTLLFHEITKGLWKLPYADTQCGFKAFRSEKTRKILQEMKSKGLAWDVEFLYRCRKADLRVAEIPIRWNFIPGGPLESQKFQNVATLLWDVLTLRGRI